MTQQLAALLTVSKRSMYILCLSSILIFTHFMAELDLVLHWIAIQSRMPVTPPLNNQNRDHLQNQKGKEGRNSNYVYLFLYVHFSFCTPSSHYCFTHSCLSLLFHTTVLLIYFVFSFGTHDDFDLDCMCLILFALLLKCGRFFYLKACCFIN